MRIHQYSLDSKRSARYGSFSGKYDYHEHIHQYCEIVFCQEGSMELTVDDKTMTMKEGDFAVISPFRIHGFYTPEYVRRWICVFSDNLIPKFVSQDEIISTSESCVFHADKKLVDFLKDSLPDNREELVEMNDLETRMICVITSCVFEEYLRKVKTEPLHQNKTLLQILIYIKQHYKENLTLANIGRAIGYSPKYVSNCISSIKNYNLTLLVNSLRIDNAKDMLINTDMKIIDIAAECGYNNERSFYNAFRAITNMTPKDYRIQKKKLK